ncbi:hypothetical protein [Leifsonia sp. EB34]|uniref:hypothetical protein n=1 Tax=Leifsonia sp. EB34 TaxID=3156303 RepID=UPI003515AC97
MSGAGRVVSFAVLYAVVVGGLVLGAGLSSAAAVRDARDFVTAGAAVYAMKAAGRIDGPACDAMSSLANVGASGALRERGDSVSSARLPTTPLTLFTVSPGFAALLPASGDANSAGLSLSSEAAATLGVEAGNTLETTHGVTRVASVFEYPDDGRDPLLAFAAIESVSGTTTFDQCWAMIWPHDEKAVASLGRTVLPVSGEAADRPILMQLNQTLGARFVPSALVDRSTMQALVVAAGGLLGVLFALRRRLALASDRHVGVSRSAQVLSQSCQVLLWTALGSGAAIAAVIIAVRLADEDRLPIFYQSAALVVAGGGAAVVGSAVAVCLVRESALFRYFKQR